ncbi:RICIN domain-containing protein [Streptomyces litchfieldiae]|uniref:RICIN domain-containing protein n=1 Tax=Streptomyces litchfieldiae TaxID=3075543 RepID=A0ABU2N3W2_9ACTN|nr:RICIN domain-containing protein [Streptomyces sp. DSM 44938]MDT0347753.1 RICIN domain-containing protein [Streptomyces sp. DSM 44938]
MTDADGALVHGDPVTVADRRATVTVPGQSVTTFLVEGVSGVARDAALVQRGGEYTLTGVQSGRALTADAAGTGTVIRTPDAADAAQTWELEKVTRGETNRERYVLTSAADGRRLAERDGSVVLEPDRGRAPAAAQWIMSTTGDGTWTLVTAASGRVLEVPGQATSDGAPVGTWQPNSGANQRWTVTETQP